MTSLSSIASNAPTVSVIVPTHRRPELLRRALRSVLAQTYTGPIECLVVFDQEDPTDLGLPETDGRTIRTITNTRAPGLAGARNTGILRARGDLVAFCDDDDEWVPEKLVRQVTALDGDERAVVAASGVTVVYGDRSIDRVPPAERITLPMLLRSRLTELHPSTFIAWRSRLIEQNGLVDESIPGSYGEDYDWLLRAARSQPILAVRQPLARVYWHRASYFAQRWQMIIDALQFLLRRYPEFGTEPVGQARIEGQIAFAHAALGNGTDARRWARLALRHSFRERRAYLALLVSTRLLSADRVLAAAHRIGRGI